MPLPGSHIPWFRRVLIANRGEIAVRISRTLVHLGIAPIAVYSAADTTAAHVRAAALALPLGPAPAQQSYLCIDKILAAAGAAEANAIHPGYGFLAENADFAEQVTAAKLVFIGPSSQCIRLMGQKTAARALMQQVGVPVVPGSDGPLASLAAAQEIAQKLGYPVMLKAVAGGGGKGMRRVDHPEQLPAAWRAAQSEALNTFADSSIYLEKALLAPRHIEVQIFADAQGRVVALGERECSMQRRHQKIIEESPSTLISSDLRSEMIRVACQAAQAVNYCGAGTVEFIVDVEQQKPVAFYFLEMNTRLQVEHPLTEMRFGLDLVALQLLVAAGHGLPWSQVPKPRGHALEVRVCAEDPLQNFTPQPGRILVCNLPAGPGIRVDAGVSKGDQISTFYDPLLMKIIAYGENREQARCRMLRALQETQILGIRTNVSFLSYLLKSEAFQSGTYHTETIADLLPSYQQQWSENPLPVAVAAIVHFLQQKQQLQLHFQAPPAADRRIRVL